jgi:hypothetical protein
LPSSCGERGLMYACQVGLEFVAIIGAKFPDLEWKALDNVVNEGDDDHAPSRAFSSEGTAVGVIINRDSGTIFRFYWSGGCSSVDAMNLKHMLGQMEINGGDKR